VKKEIPPAGKAAGAKGEEARAAAPAEGAGKVEAKDAAIPKTAASSAASAPPKHMTKEKKSVKRSMTK